MGIHDVDRADRLPGLILEDVEYLRTDGIAEIEQWNGSDLAESVRLVAGGQSFTFWVSEGSVDTVAIAGDPSEVGPTQYTKLTAQDRVPWCDVIGRRVTGTRLSFLPGEEATYSRPMVRAIELVFEGGRSVTLAGYRPSDDLASNCFDDLAVLDGDLEAAYPDAT
ncbi:MAG: hypothetical protein JWL76_1478 [Thermoleophilia bacterium]|nr:hypothetical protein [Thermoleophilia bacterium]